MKGELFSTVASMSRLGTTFKLGKKQLTLRQTFSQTLHLVNRYVGASSQVKSDFPIDYIIHLITSCQDRGKLIAEQLNKNISLNLAEISRSALRNNTRIDFCG